MLLVIDTASVYSALAPHKLDYKAYVDYIKKHIGTPSRMVAFVEFDATNGNKAFRGFLKKLGFEVEVKPTKTAIQVEVVMLVNQTTGRVLLSTNATATLSYLHNRKEVILMCDRVPEQYKVKHLDFPPSILIKHE